MKKFSFSKKNPQLLSCQPNRIDGINPETRYQSYIFFRISLFNIPNFPGICLQYFRKETCGLYGGKGVSTPGAKIVVEGIGSGKTAARWIFQAGAQHHHHQDRISFVEIPWSMLQENRRGPPTRARTGNFLYLYILPGRSSSINRGGRITSAEVCTHTHARVQHAEFRSRIHAETSVKDAESRQPVGPRLIGGLLKLTCQPDSPPTALVTRGGRRGGERCFATLTPGLINRCNFLSLSLSFFFVFTNNIVVLLLSFRSRKLWSKRALFL